MNNKAINEFGFHRIQRIEQISEDVINEAFNTLLLILFIIHSKYFPDSDWLKAHI